MWRMGFPLSPRPLPQGAREPDSLINLLQSKFCPLSPCGRGLGRGGELTDEGQNMKIISQIYRSKKEEGMYLYVKKEEGLTRVPDDLLKLFGKPEPAMVLVLTPEKKLAHAKIENVLVDLETKGFYLQLPPRDQVDQEAKQVRAKNSKLSG